MLFKQKTMIVKLRSVRKEDWKFILKIRNYETVRNACHDTSIISFEQHVKYMKKINDYFHSHQWIVTYDEKEVGHAKIIEHEFGYMIDEQFCNKGIGTKIIELVSVEAKKLGIKRLHYTTKINNHVSLRVALKSGFIQKDMVKKDGKPYAYSLVKKL
jgi:RimJ/RimL family protein N-acetyltransferase